METYSHQLRECNYNIENRRSYTKKKGSEYHKYCNDIFVFDIEVTNAWLTDKGRIIKYKKGKSNDYWNEQTPLALCYLWQFSFNDKVYYGRELREFEEVLKDLPQDTHIIIWTHNLSYEFHFLNNFLKWKSVFARSPHKPIKCVCEKYPNIEFRCSYMLTRLSLESWGKQIGFYKDVGYLDYEEMRTPLTPLTEKELQYGKDDCLVVYHGILDYLKRYDKVRNIPLTQTGIVRRVVKDKLMTDKKYKRFIKKLIPHDADEYKMLIQVFSGGYTHANRYYSGVVQTGHIEHYDFASSYPSVMVCEKYPMTSWLYQYDKELPNEDTFNDFAYILKLRFTNIKCKTFNTYIQSSKCDGNNFKYDNGRIISADELIMYMTEQDYLTIKETYTYDTIEVLEKYRSRKDYLPKPFIEYILELYHNKTTLKDIEGMEDLYMQSKQYINSLFGMAVTAIVQPNVEFKDNIWSIQPLTEEYVNNHLSKLRNTREREKRYFLSYSWGCYVTAYARRNLWKCIISCDEDVIYCDTDSIFVHGHKDFTWYNDEINYKMKLVCDTLDLDYNKTRPKTPKGIEKPLGIFASEDSCSEFITLGAKRYVERREHDNKLHLTVSGINKGAVELLNNDIENFVDGFNFDKDSDCVKKLLATYTTDMPVVKFKDGYVSTYKEGINMRRTGYLLSMTDEYKKLIEYANIKVADLDEHVIMRIKASFRTERGG